MSDNPAHEVLRDLLSFLESMETQSQAVVQFLKDKGILTDQQLAPYVEQAATASGVKWRAARVRMEHLFAISERTIIKSSSARREEVDTKTEGESKAPENAAKIETSRHEESARKSEHKASPENAQLANDAAAKTLTEHHSSPPEAKSSQEEPNSAAGTRAKEQHRKAS